MAALWLRVRIRIAAWLYRVASRVEPNASQWARLFPPYVLSELHEQLEIAIQLQGVDDVYRERRVRYKIKQRYPQVRDHDVFVYTRDALAHMARTTPVEDPHAAAAFLLPSHLRRRRV